MTIKLSPVLDVAREIPIPSLESTASTFELAVPLGNRSLPGQNGTIDFDLGSYQIALVPFPVQAGGSPPKNGGSHQPLLLPLTWNELITEVRREIGGSSFAKQSHVVRFGQVHIDLLSMEAHRSDRTVSLTAMEFKVLKFFVSNPNRVISRDELLNQVWGYENYPCTRTVDNHVLRLRQKLEADLAHPVHFRTVHGIGYKFIP